MEIPKHVAKKVKPLLAEAPDKRKPYVKFHVHCIILAVSMIGLAIIVSLHCMNETESCITGFIPNFMTEVLDRIKRV